MTNNPTWHPTATIATLKQRAKILAKIRTFFAERQVLEVETPLLSHHTVTDPYVRGIPALFQANGAEQPETFYLQTSPEYAMKRLLAADSGPIYQISKAFRQGDVGRLHNPEFTMLEWYRPGFDHHALMDEMDALLQFAINTQPAERATYAEIFIRHAAIDPFSADHETLLAKVRQHISLASEINDRDVLLDLLLTHCIEPQLGQERPIFIYDFPVSQASLAKIRQTATYPVASRFEVYFKGLELANGFHELQDAAEQQARFIKDLAYRQQHQMPTVAIDERLLAALTAGLPDCAGVALGVDRLVLLALGLNHLADVISFSLINC